MDEYTNGYNELKGKETNPKDSLGIKKVPMHCVSARVMMELGLAMFEGSRKYGTHNYRSMGVRASVYYDATMRHLMDWWEGTDIDADSGVSHIVKAIAGLVVLRDSMIMENWEDDRPIRLPGGLGITSLNEQAGKIIEKYPVSKDPYTEKSLTKEVKHEEGKVIFGDAIFGGRNSDPNKLCQCDLCKPRWGQDLLS
jgi:hypothetical protein